MKKALQLLMVPAFCLVGYQAVNLNASAQQANCDNANISNTGAGSQNEIICQDTHTVVIQCANDTVVRINLDQNANSGNANSEGNTNGGGTSTGDATNESNNNIDVNSACGDVASAETPGTPSTPVTPTSTPVVSTPTPAEATKTVAELPNTGNTTPGMIVALSTVAIACLAGISQVSVFAYRHFTK